MDYFILFNSFWTQNRMYQLARANIGLSNQIGGTGFAIDTKVLKKFGWGAKCLTEDLEFTCKMILNGEKVGWAHDAIIYDEKPLTLKQSWVQRRRWMQGFADVATRYFTKLVKKGLKERKGYVLDCALYVIQPFITIAMAVSALLSYIASSLPVGDSIFVMNYLVGNRILMLITLIQFLMTPLILKLDKKISVGFFIMFVFYAISTLILPMFLKGLNNRGQFLLMEISFNILFLISVFLILGKEKLKFFIRFLLYSFYTLTWVPITVEGIIRKNNKEWNPTKHVRNVEILDMH